MSQQLWHSLLPLNYKLRTMIRRVIAPLQMLAGHVAAANNKVQTNLLFFTRSLTKIEFSSADTGHVARYHIFIHTEQRRARL